MKPWQLGDGDNTVSTEQLRMEFIFDSINRQLAAIGVTDQTTFDAFANYIGYSTGGTPSYQDMQVAWTPSNLNLGEQFIFELLADTTPALTALTFSGATIAGMDIESTTMSFTISVPNATAIVGGGFIYVDGNTGLTSFSAPSLVDFGGSTLHLKNNTSLASTNFAALLPVDGNNIDFRNCALNQASIDQILARCVASVGYVNNLISLDGGTNSAPSSIAPGSNYDILTVRGNTVTVNP